MQVLGAVGRKAVGRLCSSSVVQFLKKVITSGWRPGYLFSPQNYFKNTSSPCLKNMVFCHTLSCVTWLSSHCVFPQFSCGR